jgi:4-amino-4-deoxy-L-arabinose transferase-like glycosyltransferase
MVKRQSMSFLSKHLDSSRTIGWLLCAHFVLWLSVSLILDIHPDMADHWVWSRFPAFGYYEHPPMVALTMRLATLIGGHHLLTLKVGSVLFSVFILWLAYRVGVLFFNQRTALLFVAILACTPYFSAGSVFWHINQPYMVFWLLGLYAMGRLILSHNLNWIFVFGIAAGFGALSKYIMVLFPLALLIWAIINPGRRQLLFHWKTYLAALIALAIVAPNIYWNAQRDWVTFLFVLDKGLTGARFGEHFLHFILSQLVLFSIVFAPLFWWYLLRARIRAAVLFKVSSTGRERYSLLLITGLLPVAFFSVTSFAGSRTDPSWVNVAYFSLFLLLARFLEQGFSAGQASRISRLLVSAFVVNLALVAGFLSQIHFSVLPFELSDAPSTDSLLGWGQTARQIETLYQQAETPIPPFVISREYQLSSALSLYLSNHAIPHSIEKFQRNEWSPVERIRQQGATIVCVPTECDRVLERTAERFQRPHQPVGTVEVDHFGRVVRVLNVYWLLPLDTATDPAKNLEPY